MYESTYPCICISIFVSPPKFNLEPTIGGESWPLLGIPSKLSYVDVTKKCSKNEISSSPSLLTLLYCTLLWNLLLMATTNPPPPPRTSPRAPATNAFCSPCSYVMQLCRNARCDALTHCRTCIIDI